MAKTENKYNPALDICLAPALVFHVDESNGTLVGAPAEKGTLTVVAVLRSMHDAEGKPGPQRIALHQGYISKGPSANGKMNPLSMNKWCITGKGRPTFHEVPPAGALVIGSSLGRVNVECSAAVFAEVAKYSALVQRKLAEKNGAAATK